MFFLYLIAASFFIQLFTCAWYIISESSEKITNPFKFKILCPLLYLGDIIFAFSFKDAYTDLFSVLTLCGFVLYFTGELLTLIIGKNKFNISGSFFTAGKLLFTASLCILSKKLFNSAVFTLKDIIMFAVLLSLLLFILIKNRKIFGKFFYQTVLFGTADVLFITKSAVGGIMLLLQNSGNSKSLSFILIFGGAFIIISDIMYIYMIFFGKYSTKNAQLRAYIHYYGMMIFSCSVLFCGG